MQPYSIFRPECDPRGLIFNSPHSGTFLPKKFLKQISIAPDLLHYSGDILVDKLIKNAPLFGATCFINNFARTYVDTNRAANEIDRDMFLNTTGESDFDRTQKVAMGFGLFSRKSYNGQNIYPDKMPSSEINHRLDLVYHPVHKALATLLDHCHQDHGYYLLLDCHSMPSYEFIDSGLSNNSQPDLIIGNCFENSCAPDLSQHVANYFIQHGLNVAFNVPYPGGFNTRHYGMPEQQKNTLQLEFSRVLYMDEKTLKSHDGFDTLQRILTGLSENLVKNLSGFFPSEKGL
ncbi:MAG: N-formylglutamate amidohydrolase [Alphaproteobacteria bacterium]|nr:MAG: N-formylglutamate amidohydrolase [Alphaproteobacteria bacterium]